MIALHAARARHRRTRRTGLAGAVLVFSLTASMGSLDDARAATPTPTPGATAPTSAAASGSEGLVTFGIKPAHATTAKPLDTRARFDYSATPGAVQPDYVAVTNDARSSVHLTIYASDGLNTENDGFDLLPASKKPLDVGQWITLRDKTLDIKPGATVVVPFKVRVPVSAEPGDHIGGIVASLRTVEVDKKGDRVAVDHRVGVRVYLRVQGALSPRLTVTNLKAKYHNNWWNPFGSGKVTVSYTVHNVGNVRLGASQSVSVAGWYAGTAQSPPISDVTELLPGNVHGERIDVTSVVPAFHQKAVVTVIPLALSTDVDGQLVTVSAKVHFWAIPWALLFWLLVLASLTGFLLRRRLRTSVQPVKASTVTKDRKGVGAKP